MRPRRLMRTWILAVGMLLAAIPTAQAARLRCHYVMGQPCGVMTLQSAIPEGSLGSRYFVGQKAQPQDYRVPRATQIVTFQHPATGQPVKVPLALPEGTPNMEYRTRRTVYNYGSYNVQVLFLADGSIDVLYNTGLLRGL